VPCESAHHVPAPAPAPPATAQVQAAIPDKNTKIVVGCRSGVRSKSAGDLLTAAGYTDVSNILGGWLDWQNAGFAIERLVSPASWHAAAAPCVRRTGPASRLPCAAPVATI
jgi:hypothetical protein